ncbi:outer membrane efflux protein [Leptospira broomii serovar Hurstbridge str. 5399]|uniref:Outer membrane efflux protein n=1 Tax=Leptospira broomii serovar Hurstbridge str. 5399 TaxID=1049789 RepID=T0G9E5_9LEPT|nr:TolC family protein [Leptospira broomii]EQA43454.1 outer membrane efflux protein [Leptospira broomii serovar Hurstbridge str. 5399]
MSAQRTFSIIIIFLVSLPIFSEAKRLEEILEILAKEHPEAKSLAGVSHAHKSHSDASGILPDPKIGFAYRNYPTRNGYSLNGNRALDTPTMTGMEFSVSQEFPFPGKLGTEKRISKIMENEATLGYLVGVNRMLGDFFIRLNRFQRIEKKKQINGRILDLLNAQKSITEGYYSAGTVPLTGALKASIAKTDAMEKEAEYNTNLKDLTSQLEYYKVLDRVSLSDLFQINLDSFLEESLQRLNSLANSGVPAVEDTPDYKILLAEEKRLKEQTKLTKYSIAPQTEVFFSYMKRKSQTFSADTGPLNYSLMDTTEYRGDLFSFGVNMRVPVWSALKWNSITGETEHLAEVGKDSVDKTRAQMVSEINRGIEVIRGTSNQIQIVEKKLIPEMEKAARASASLYAPGKANIQDTLLAQTEVLNAKIRLEDLRERKNETILNMLKLLSLIYQDQKVPRHEKHQPEVTLGRGRE